MANEFNIEAIFKKYKDKVYRLALSIARNEKDAQDITQNTFLKIIKNLKYFRKESLISTWIYKIAHNEALMYLRKRKSQFRLSNYLQYSRKKEAAGLFVNWSKLPDEQLLDSEFKERVNASIRHLPIKYRIPLLLDNVERLPLKMSAKIMGLNVNSLKTRLHRAHLMIKSDITDYFRDKNIAQEKKNRKCGIWTGFVYNYAKGCLGKKQESSFRIHIKDCPSCKSFLDSYLKAVFITNGLECQDLPLELKEKIETFIFKNKQKH